MIKINDLVCLALKQSIASQHCICGKVTEVNINGIELIELDLMTNIYSSYELFVNWKNMLGAIMVFNEDELESLRTFYVNHSNSFNEEE